MKDDVAEVQELSGNRDKSAMDQLMAEIDIPETKPPPPPEKKVEPPPVAPPPAAKVEPEITPPVSEPEPPAAPPPVVEEKDPLKIIDSVRLRSDASPKTSESFEIVKTQGKAGWERAKILEAELAAERQEKEDLKKKQITPEYEQKMRDLETFQQTFGVENDPQFNSEFETAINDREGAAIGLLRQWRILPDGAAKYVLENGGANQFRYSKELMPPNFKNDDGTPMTHSGYWTKYVQPNLSPDRQEELNDIFGEIRAIRRERDARLEDIRANRENYIKDRTEQTAKLQTDWKGRANARAAALITEFGDEAKAKVIPPDATPEQRAAIEKHNARVITAANESKKIAAEIFKSPEVFVETIMHAIRGKALGDILKERDTTLAARDATIADLQKQLDAIKASATTTHKTIPMGHKRPEAPKPPPSETAVQAMDRLTKEHFEAARR